jgi:hypothetical protein
MCWNFSKVLFFNLPPKKIINLFYNVLKFLKGVSLWLSSQEDWFYIELHFNTKTIQMIWNKCTLQ